MKLTCSSSWTRKKLAPAPEAVDNLLNDRAAMAKFVKQFQKLDKSFGEIQVYMEWADKDLERDYGISHQDFDDYLGKYQNVLEALKHSRDDDGDDVTIDIEYELETIRKTQGVRSIAKPQSIASRMRPQIDVPFSSSSAVTAALFTPAFSGAVAATVSAGFLSFSSKS